MEKVTAKKALDEERQHKS